MNPSSACYAFLMLKALASEKLRHQLATVLAGEEHDPSLGNALERRLHNCLVLIPKLDLPALHCFGQGLYCLFVSAGLNVINYNESSDLRDENKTVSSVRPFGLF